LGMGTVSINFDVVIYLFYQFGYSCYMSGVMDKGTWLDASNYCKSQNTSLWSINSHMEYEMVFTATKMNTSFWVKYQLESTFMMFIGLHYNQKVFFILY